jgi:hypothetical protein
VQEDFFQEAPDIPLTCWNIHDHAYFKKVYSDRVSDWLADHGICAGGRMVRPDTSGDIQFWKFRTSNCGQWQWGPGHALVE